MSDTFEEKYVNYIMINFFSILNLSYMKVGKEKTISFVEEDYFSELNHLGPYYFLLY